MCHPSKSNSSTASWYADCSPSLHPDRFLRPFITQSMHRSHSMTRHFGVLIPSTNTTVEIECRLLPAAYQAHVGRLKSSGAGSFAPSRDEDIDYQSHLLGTARVEMIILAQTSASLFAEDY